MKNRASQLILACMLLLGSSACQRIAYPTLPKTTAYHQSFVKVLPAASFKSVVIAGQASALPQVLRAPKPTTSKKAVHQLVELPKKAVSRIRLPLVSGSRAVGQSQPSVRLASRPRMAHLRISASKPNTASVQGDNSLVVLYIIFFSLAIILPLLGLVGFFVFSAVWLKILCGIVALMGIMALVKIILQL